MDTIQSSKNKLQQPEISVVMSVYNDEKYVGLSIESILEQSYPHFEFIIINDGSTDSSAGIIKTYAEQDNRIIIIDNGKNIGLIRSLNIGLSAAKGKYIARMDSDDISEKDRFQQQFDFLEKNKDVFLVGTSEITIDEDGNKKHRYRRPQGFAKIKKLLMKRNCICHPSIMFRNGENILYREKMYYAQDYDFYLRCLSEGKILRNIDQPLLLYRNNPSSISLSKSGYQALFGRQAREFYWQREADEPEGYNDFNPDQIMNADLKHNRTPAIILSELYAAFELNDKDKMKTYLQEYIQKYGFYFNRKFCLIFLCSHLNVKLMVLIKRMIWK